MKGTVTVLVCDDTPDSAGRTFKAEELSFSDGDIDVVLEFDRTSLAHYVGKAKLRLSGNLLLADLTLLDARMVDPARAVLYPIPVLVNVDGKDKQVTKAEVRYISLSIGQHSDRRIGTLFTQGVKP